MYTKFEKWDTKLVKDANDCVEIIENIQKEYDNKLNIVIDSTSIGMTLVDALRNKYTIIEVKSNSVINSKAIYEMKSDLSKNKIIFDYNCNTGNKLYADKDDMYFYDGNKGIIKVNYNLADNVKSPLIKVLLAYKGISKYKEQEEEDNLAFLRHWSTYIFKTNNDTIKLICEKNIIDIDKNNKGTLSFVTSGFNLDKINIIKNSNIEFNVECNVEAISYKTNELIERKHTFKARFVNMKIMNNPESECGECKISLLFDIKDVELYK